MRLLHRSRDQRGFASIETIVAIVALTSTLTLGFGAAYGAFAKGWVARGAREAAICLSTPTPPGLCRQKLESSLTHGLPFGDFIVSEFSTSNLGTRVSVKIQWTEQYSSTLTAVVKKPIYFPRGRG